jgi:hypothetical protein
MVLVGVDPSMKGATVITLARGRVSDGNFSNIVRNVPDGLLLLLSSFFSDETILGTAERFPEDLEEGKDGFTT